MENVNEIVNAFMQEGISPVTAATFATLADTDENKLAEVELRSQNPDANDDAIAGLLHDLKVDEDEDVHVKAVREHKRSQLIKSARDFRQTVLGKVDAAKAQPKADPLVPNQAGQESANGASAAVATSVDVDLKDLQFSIEEGDTPFSYKFQQEQVVALQEQLSKALSEQGQAYTNEQIRAFALGELVKSNISEIVKEAIRTGKSLKEREVVAATVVTAGATHKPEAGHSKPPMKKPFGYV
jgi:hypothetical protein